MLPTHVRYKIITASDSISLTVSLWLPAVTSYKITTESYSMLQTSASYEIITDYISIVSKTHKL